MANRRSKASRAATNTICAALAALAGLARDWAEHGAGSLAAAGADWAEALDAVVCDLENARDAAGSISEMAVAGRELMAALRAAARSAGGVSE